MNLGEPLRRLMAMHEREVARMRERFAARVRGHDAVEHSGSEKLASFRRGSDPVWTARAEPLASFVSDLGVLRWWWHGRIGQTPSRLDTIVAEGQTYDVEELAHSAASVESLQNADSISAMAAYLAGAEGLLRLERGQDWDFYALYDAPGARITVPAPAVPSTSSPPPAARAAMSLPPPPVAPTVAREPARELVSPVGVEALRAVKAALPMGYQQALLTVVIDAQGGKAKLFLHLAALNMAHDIVSLDPSQPLFDSVVAMISEHRRRGGADVRKLVLRLRPRENGASFELTVA